MVVSCCQIIFKEYFADSREMIFTLKYHLIYSTIDFTVSRGLPGQRGSGISILQQESGMAKQKKTKRTLQAEETKRKIYNSAIAMIEKKGFENITIQDINSHAGVSVGTFYHYYKSKEDVFFELYRTADEYFEDKVFPVIYSGEFTANERILLFFRSYARFNIENGLEYVSQLYNTKNKFFISRNRYMLDLLIRIIQEGQKKNEIKTELDPEEIMEDLFIVCRGIVFDWCLHEGSYDLEEKMHGHLKRHLPVFSTAE